MIKSKISASMMCSDLINLERDIREVDQAGCDYFHIDIMDGVFVPNFMLSNDFILNIRKISNKPMDIHLMITEPENKIGWFDVRKDDFVTIHYESTTNVLGTLQTIRKIGAKPAIALNPATPINVVEYILDDIDMVVLMTVNPGFSGRKLVSTAIKKIADLRKFLDERNKKNIIIEADGNVSIENATQMRKAGADMFVAGSSSVFRKDWTISDGMKKLREALEAANKE